MTCSWLHLLLGIAFGITSAQAHVCENDDNEIKKAQSILNSMVRPPNMAGSCAIDQERGGSSWKDQLPKQVSEFMEKNVFSEKMGFSAKIKNTLNADLMSEKVLGYGEARNRAEWDASFAKRLNDPKLGENLIALAKKKRCAKGVDFFLEPASGMNTEVFGSNNEAKARAAINTSVKEEESYAGEVTFCSPVLKRQSELVESPGEMVAYDIPKDLFFSDNQSTIPEAKMKQLKAEMAKKLSMSDSGCKQKRIEAVDIITSSNLLANSDAIGRWNFKKLSDDRANFIKGQLADLFADQRGNPNFPKFSENENFDSITTVNSDGENGDGTSGPCPYKKREEKGVLVVERDLNVKAAELDASKYANINFSTICLDRKPGGKAIETKPVTYYASQCYSIRVACKSN